MLEPIAKKLINAEKLIYKAEFEDALKIIEGFEKEENNTIEDSISSLLLRGVIYTLNAEFDKCVKVGRGAYRLAQNHDMVLESIQALLFKANIIFLGEAEKGLKLLLECERLINSLGDKSSLTILKHKGYLLLLKSWGYLFKGELDSALELAEKSLFLRKKTRSKIEIAFNYLLLGNIYWNLGDLESALDHALKSLNFMEQVSFHRGISSSSYLVGYIYMDNGDLNKAKNFCKQSLSFKEIDIRTKLNNLIALANISYIKSELDKSLKYAKQAKKLAEEHHIYDFIAYSLNCIGMYYTIKGDHDLAIESFESCLEISEKIGWVGGIATLAILVLVYLQKDSQEQAQQYLIRLKNISDQENKKNITRYYHLAKATMLKTSGRTHNRAEAETLFKKLVDEAEDAEFRMFSTITSDVKMFSLCSLCDLYLEDLHLSNNIEILRDINELITQMLDFAEKRHSYVYLAEAKLLQAKLALIQMNVSEAEKLLVEAQRIAEFHGFDLLAMKISSEHDRILAQSNIWDDLEKKNATFSERIKLASLDGVLDRLKRKRVVDPPKLVEEESTLLLIIGEGGVLFFSHPFTAEWEKDDELFSSFLSAFTSFSDEFFSEGLDRVKFGKYTVLMESIGSYSVCYLYKGQSYPAKLKLTEFTERLHNTKSIWQLLEKSYQTGQVLELKDSLPLKSIITDIFLVRNPIIIS